jgi:hypothetical protein
MITPTPHSALRWLQILLAVASIATLFLPWITYLSTRMDASIERKTAPGWELSYGSPMAMFVLSGFLVSLLEVRFGRRAAFCHMGLFGATLLMAVVLLLPPDTGLREMTWGFDAFLVLAVPFFASSAMLSPPVSRYLPILRKAIAAPQMKP